MGNIWKKVKSTRILAAIGVVCLILGIIMPYINYEYLFGYTLTITLWNYWEGKVITVLIIATIIFIFKDIVEKYIPALLNNNIGRKVQELDSTKYSMVPTIIIALFDLYLIIKLGGNMFKFYNIGFYSLWIGIICLIAYSILHRNKV